MSILVLGIRPPEAIKAFWRGQIVIEENAVILDPVYWEVA